MKEKSAWIPCGLGILLLIVILLAGGNIAEGRSHRSLGTSENDYANLDDGKYLFFTVTDFKGNSGGYIRYLIETDMEAGKITASEKVNSVDPFQHYYITRQKNGYYSIISVSNWKYLAVDESGLLCENEEFKGDENQLWYFQYLGEDRYAFGNVKYGYLKNEGKQFTASYREQGEWMLKRVEEKEN